MRHRWKVLLSFGLVGVGAASVFGGWAVVTADDIPEYAVANRPFDFRYTVRQHGATARGDLAGAVVLSSGGHKQTTRSRALGEGVYEARLSFPTAGRWEMKVESGWGPVGGEMPSLPVIAAGASAPAPLSAHDRGQQLYLAKGCVTCHTHALLRGASSVKVGPDLSEPKFAADYLARFLADPSIKKDWKGSDRMPDLGLRPAEVAALSAFLSQPVTRRSP